LHFKSKSKSTYPCPASKSARVLIDLEEVWVATLAALEAAFLVAAANDDAMVGCIIMFNVLFLSSSSGVTCRGGSQRPEASKPRLLFSYKVEQGRGEIWDDISLTPFFYRWKGEDKR